MRSNRMDKTFLKETLHIALPIALQFLLANLLNLLDTIMVGRLGEQPLAGVTAGNNVFFIYSLFIVGISSGAGIFTAQYYGAKNHEGIRRVTGMSLLVGTAITALFTVVVLLFVNPISKVFAADPVVADYAREYILIILISYLPTVVIECYSGVLKNSGQVRLPLVASVIALSLNTLLNYVLIYGKLGMPALGVRGAAIATVIARVLQMALLLILVYRDRHIVACPPRRMLGFDGGMFRQFMKISSPVMINEGLWALGTVVYNAIYGQMGTRELAVIAIVSNAERIFMFIFMGLGYAALALVGKKIGEGRQDLAYRYAVNYAKLSFVIGAVIGGLLIVCAPLILRCYNITPDTLSVAYRVMIVLGVFMTIKSFNLVNIIGNLRSGGDTVTAAALDLSAVWLIGVPLAFLGGIVLKLPMPFVYLMIMTEELYKLSIGLWRLKSKRWIKSIA